MRKTNIIAWLKKSENYNAHTTLSEGKFCVFFNSVFPAEREHGARLFTASYIRRLWLITEARIASSVLAWGRFLQEWSFCQIPNSLCGGNPLAAFIRGTIICRFRGDRPSLLNKPFVNRRRGRKKLLKNQVREELLYISLYLIYGSVF